MYVIDFAPPILNIDNDFNTVRLGVKWSRILKPGDIVLLVNKPKSEVMCKAVVRRISVGKLKDLAPIHAVHNHNQKGLDPSCAPERLIAGMIKRYGPHKCDVDKKITVIDLRKLEND